MPRSEVIDAWHKLAERKEELLAQIALLDPARPVSWAVVLDLAGALRIKVTRQWLGRDGNVCEAFRNAKERHHAHRPSPAGRKRGPRDLLEALAEIEELKANLKRRDALLEEYDQRFFKYLHNARRKEWSIDDLERQIQVG